MILESERRWDDFQGGQPIELPDGQVWYFHTPEARTRGGRPGWTFGRDVPADVDAILSHRLSSILLNLQRAEAAEDRAAVLLHAGWFLLARNYNLAAEEFRSIMAGAAAWDEAKHKQFAESLATLIGVACIRSTALAEIA